MRSMSSIHPTALVEEGAQLGDGVRIGPYCIVGERAVLDDGVELVSHVVISGVTEIGARTKVFPFASLGAAPQHLKYAGEESRLSIGHDCTIREHVTMNPGTAFGGMETVVGSHCYFMVGSHVAHDSYIGDHVILINNATIGGHCRVGDHAIVGGLAAIHQWVRIGEYAFISGCSAVADDIIPFGSAIGNRAHLGGLNIVGLKRHGFEREDIHVLRQAYRLLFSNEGTLAERVADVGGVFPEHPLVRLIIDFIKAGDDRPLCLPRNGRGG